MKWEYKVYLISPFTVIEDRLNVMGEDGWELVTAYAFSGYNAVYMKRSKTVDSYGR